MGKSFIFACVCISVLVFMNPTNICAENFYVRATGGESGSDGSDWNNAFDGFGDVQWGNELGKVGAGDILYVAGGTYASSLIAEVSGTDESNRIIIRRATTSQHGTDTGWENVFDGQVTLDGNARIYISDKNYVTVDGMTEDGFFIPSPTTTDRFGVEIRNCNFVTVQYFTTDGSANGDDYRGITIRHSNDIAVQYAVFQNMPNDAIQLLSVSNLLIEHCYIGPRIESSTGKHADGIEGWITSDVTFRYNTLDWYGDGIQLGIGVGEGSPSGKWDIYGNLFIGKSNPYTGTSYKSNSKNATIGPLNFYNNVFYKIYVCFRILSNTSGYIKNNIFYDTQNISLGQLIHSNNYYEVGVDPPEENKQVGGDPFVNSSAFNFNLNSTSNAINTGATLSDIYKIDANINERGKDGYWDIGAYEYSISPRNLRLTN